MIFRNLDKNGDWTFGRGKGNFVAENNAIRLNIKTRLMSWIGDCFFDMGAGIDWINRLGSKNQRALLEQDIRNIISKTPDVRRIIDFSTDLTGRKFTANYTVETIYSKNFTDSLERSI